MPFENWEVDNKTSVIKYVVVGLIVLLAVAFSAKIAFDNFSTAPEEKPSAQEYLTLSTPEVSSYSVVVGETVSVTVSLSEPSEDQQIMFYEKYTPIGSYKSLDTDYVLVGNADTNSEGVAVFDRTVKNVGTYNFRCECVIQ